MAQAMVNFRMDADLKKSMEQTCQEMGMSMTTAFTIFATKVSREKRIPFEISADPFYSESNMKHLSKVISDIETVILNNKTPIKFIRFNEVGDFISYKHFKKANKIATYFKNKYNIISYSYTHNIELERYITEINNSNIVVNYSYDIKTDLSVKKCIVINEQEIKNYVNDHNYIICTGSCTNCSYCKNQSDKRIIIFLDHAKKSITKMLQDNLNKSDLIKLESKKLIDYGNFLLDTIK